MAGKRARRERQKANRAKVRGNAVRIEGAILPPGRCLLRVMVGNPAQMPADGQLQEKHLTAIDAVIDTGATSACVSQELATRLGLVPHGKTRVGVVGGETDLDEAPLFLSFHKDGLQGELIYKILPVAIGNIPVPMLFGMRELSPGVLTVDCSKGSWEWKVPNSTMKKPG